MKIEVGKEIEFAKLRLGDTIRLRDGRQVEVIDVDRERSCLWAHPNHDGYDFKVWESAVGGVVRPQVPR